MPTNNEQINFQPLDAETPEGYLADVGLPYDDNRGYGWITERSVGVLNPKPLDVSNGARDRERIEDQRIDTFMHMQFPNRTPGAWEYALENGIYEVAVGVGDPAFANSIYQINVEGEEIIAGFEPSPSNRFTGGTGTVAVTDGKLTVDAIGGENTKINLIRFTPLTELVAQINFQSEDAEAPEGYLVDAGLSYDDNRGYGWIREDSLSAEEQIPWTISNLGRERQSESDQRLDTFMHMQYPGRVAGAWEYALPNGSYSVTVGVGDPAATESVHQINIEGEELIGGFTPDETENFEIATATVEVEDGKLTVDALGGENTKIDFIQIAAFDSEDASVDAKINFQPEDAETPEDYTADVGLSYDDNRGYGWIREDSLSAEDRIPWDRSDLGRERQVETDQKLDTLMHMQYPGRVAGAWEYALDNGTYEVTVSVGDAAATNSTHQINVEGVALIDSFVPEVEEAFQVGTATVDVSDGKLTVDALGGENTKINYIEIASADM
ncbi:hypothetical protein [Myxosarcina sp. GI1]|uniref:hypothetical protein n=1 Tax=Myxosarcina sp. GI1 TaxID=1541065 RepID=UPI00069114C0|nr:hypothetical protein [Myxosarcina sp. GI1]